MQANSLAAELAVLLAVDRSESNGDPSVGQGESESEAEEGGESAAESLQPEQPAKDGTKTAVADSPAAAVEGETESKVDAAGQGADEAGA